MDKFLRMRNPKSGKPKFTIGVYCSDFIKKTNTYSLIREIDGVFEVIFYKSTFEESPEDKVSFEQEVENLSKYFNAKIVKEQ
jgi:hypothetical protein